MILVDRYTGMAALSRNRNDYLICVQRLLGVSMIIDLARSYSKLLVGLRQLEDQRLP